MRLRPATPADAPAIAALAVEALRDKYRPALGTRAVDGLTAVVAESIRLGPARSGHHVVAEIDGRVAGVVHLPAGPGTGHAPGFAALSRAVGFPAALRAVLVFALPAPPALSADACYLDELAVAPWARRRGVGRALVEECARIAGDAGRGRLLLMVTADNAAARALYRAAGFTEVGRRRWVIRRRVFRAPGALILERRLPPP